MARGTATALLLCAGLCLCVGVCLAEPLPLPAGSGDKPHRPHVQTNLRPAAPGHQRPPSGAHAMTGSRLPVRSPAAVHPQRTPTSTSPQHAGKNPLSYYGYQRASSGGSSGYGSRSPSLSPKAGSPPHLSPPFSHHGAGGTTPRSWAAPSTPKAATRKPPPPCDCDCYKRPTKLLCAMDPVSREKETFLNECQLECYNCTMMKRYKVVAHVSCELHKA